MASDPPAKPSSPTPPTLDYAPCPPLAWVSRHRRLLIFLALCIAIAGPIWWNWQPLKHRVLWLYWSRQAAAFRMPQQAVAPQIIDPAEAKKIAAKDPNYILTPWPSAQYAPVAQFLPPAYRHLRQLDPRFSMRQFADSRPISFMGMLRRPDGLWRLVIVAGSNGMADSMLDSIGVEVLPVPGIFDSLPPPMVQVFPPGYFSIGKIPDLVEFKTGTIDPRDPSHIEFEFAVVDVWGNVNRPSDPDTKLLTFPSRPVKSRGTLDAYLQNDDVLKFSLPAGNQISNVALRQGSKVITPGATTKPTSAQPIGFSSQPGSPNAR